MYPWDVLGIEPTDDRKAIKKAYAQLIRQHRPDEDPEGFERINEGYNYALAISEKENRKECSDDGTVASLCEFEYETQVKQSDVSTNTEKMFVATINGNNDQPFERYVGEDELLAEQILSQLHEVAFSSIHIRYDKNNWRFIEKVNDILDFELKDHLNLEIFKRVAEYNHSNRKKIPLQMIKYIGEVLDWRDKWSFFSTHLSKEYVELNYWFFEGNMERDCTKYSPTVTERVAAWFLDMMIFSAICLVLSVWMQFELNAAIIFIGFNIYKLVFTTFTKKRVTVGTYLMKYNFLNQEFERLRNEEVLKSHLTREAVLLPFYLFSFISHPYIVLLVPIHIVVMLVFPVFKKNRLLHDLLSKQYAVKIT